MRHVPNILTVARLLFTPYVFYLLTARRFTEVLWWFGVIAFTDVADGYVARHFDATSKLGAYLDPIADKLLLSGTFFVLALEQLIDRRLAVIVLGRDALILAVAGYFYLRGKRRVFPPSIWGKASTFAQVLFVMFSVGQLAGIAVGLMPMPLGWAVLVLVLVSSIDYARGLRA